MRISDWSSDVCSSDLTEAAAVQNFRRPARAVGADYRTAAGHGFDQYIRQTFPGRRQDKERRMAEIGIGVGDVAWKGDIGPDAERLGKCFQAFFAGAVSEDDELGGMLLAQQRKGLEQCRKVFLRLNLSAAEQDGKAIRLEPRMRRRSVG